VRRLTGSLGGEGDKKYGRGPSGDKVRGERRLLIPGGKKQREDPKREGNLRGNVVKN